MKKNDSLDVELSISEVEESSITKMRRLRSVKITRQNRNNNKHESLRGAIDKNNGSREINNSRKMLDAKVIKFS